MLNNDTELKKLSAGWQIIGSNLTKEFKFNGYNKTISFVNAIAWFANKLNHHPDLEVSFGKCIVNLTTHDDGNKIGQKDFDLAAKIDQIHD